MTTLSHLRTSALALPEVTEGSHVGRTAFAVRGKGFASVTDEGLVRLRLGDEHAAEALDRLPTATPLVRMGRPIGIQVPLADVNGQHLNALLYQAWAGRAPRRLVAEQERARRGEAPADSDLPPTIGRPATRALLAAGISTLDQVAARTDEELLALHGVGPRAVRILREAIAAR